MNVFENKITEKKYIIIMLISSALLCMSAGTLPFRSTAIDSSVFIYMAKGMLNGDIPYLDMFDHKGPLLYFINLIGLLLGGKIGIWFIEIISIFLSLFFCFKSSILITKNKQLALLSTLLCFSMLGVYYDYGNLVEEYALPFISVSLYIFTKNILQKNESLKSRDCLAIGFCFGSVMLLRQNMISIWCVFCISLIIKLVIDNNAKEILRYILFFLIGVFIISAPILFYLYINNAVSSFFAQYFEFNFEYSVTNSYRANLEAFLYYFQTGISKFTLFVLILLLIKRDNKFLPISLILYYIFTLFSVSVSGYILPHYGMVLIPCYVLPMAFFVRYIWNHFAKNKKIISKIVTLVSLLSIVSMPIALISLRPLVGGSLRSAVTGSNNSDNTEQELVRLIKENSEVDDKIIVFGNYASLYLYTERFSASKYFYQFPVGVINSDYAQEFINDIKENKPKIIVDTYINGEDEIEMSIFLKEYTRLYYEKYIVGNVHLYIRSKDE